MSEKLLHQRYRLLRVTGEGGMGQVWEAEDTEAGQPVAIKQIRPEIMGDESKLEAFRQEIERLQALNHPNIMPMLDFFRQGYFYYLVMPFVPDWLADFRQAYDPFPVEWVRQIGIDLCKAVSATHEQEILHLDIKLANIALGDGFRPILTDFGLARFKFSHDLTQQGGDIGRNICHMSPEVCRGKPGDIEADIWGLGLLFYELLTGQHPFWHSNVPLMVRAIVRAPAPPFDRYRQDVPAEMQELVTAMLEKEPENRISSAKAVEAALARVPDISEPPPTWPPGTS